MGSVSTRANPVLVVGGGVPGMLQALVLAEWGRSVVLVERAPDLGGLFRSAQSPHGPLDHGIHLIYETGIAEIDQVIHGLLPEHEWIEVSGRRKDIAGNYYRGALSLGSIFPDIRKLESPAYFRAVGECMARMPINVPEFSDSASLASFFVERFGQFIYDAVLAPISEKIWKHDPAEMSAWAARTVHMTRLVMFDEQRSLALKQLPQLDKLIAYPDQLTIPDRFIVNKLSGLYPKKFGMTNVVDALERRLIQAGVRIMTNTQIEALDVEHDVAQSAALRDRSGTATKVGVSAVVWTSPIQALAPLVDVKIPSLPHSANRTATIYLFLSEPPAMGELYYFFCFDPEFATMRIANFPAFCPSALGPSGHPISVELHFSPSEPIDESKIEELAINEALELGVLRSRSLVRHVYRHPGYGGFFVPTVANVNSVRSSYEALEQSLPTNVLLASPNLGKGDFYLADGLRSAYSKILPLRDGG